MAVPNPTQITSTLRMMPDQQLQQYAAMHKNDPYIFPMAFAESNARKQERAAQQAQAMGQPQGKVVDQAVAAMGPENSGIGALAAPNMQRMADGGIAGYADGGEFNYAGADDSIVVGMAEGGIAHFQQGGQSIMRNTTPYGGVMGDIPGYVASENPIMPQVGAAEDLPFIQRKTREAAEAVRDGTATPQQKALVNWANRLGFGTPELKPRTAMPTQSPESDWPTNKPAAAANTQTPPNLGNKPPAPPTMRPAAAPAAPAAKPLSYDDRMTKLTDAARPKVEGLEALAEQRKTAMEKLGVTGETGEAQKQAYEKEASTAADEKRQMFYQSLLIGSLKGAASKSPNTITAIAEGLGLAAEEVSKGLKEFKLAEKERNKGLAAIEEARRAEKRGDVKEIIAAQEKSKDHLANFKMHEMTSQATLLGHQISADASVRGHEISAAATRAAAGASQRAQIDMINMYGNDPKFAANFDKLTAAKREPMTEGAMKAKWASEPYLQTKYPNVQDFLTMMASAASGASQLNPADLALVNKYLR
jgi:hypothetical protein